jgi:lipid II:glycine glycyltransferase (peptidoglycan interpeptide bridge formation enzyme)
VTAWISSEQEDRQWDMFLQENPSGQFQQSTFWAKTKSVNGWRPIRVVLTRGERIAGGFQLLLRPSRWGEIGYVSKGPVERAVPHSRSTRSKFYARWLLVAQD